MWKLLFGILAVLNSNAAYEAFKAGKQSDMFISIFFAILMSYYFLKELGVGQEHETDDNRP